MHGKIKLLKKPYNTKEIKKCNSSSKAYRDHGCFFYRYEYIHIEYEILFNQADIALGINNTFVIHCRLDYFNKFPNIF